MGYIIMFFTSFPTDRIFFSSNFWIFSSSGPKIIETAWPNELKASIYWRSSMLISSRSINKHGHRSQFLFLVGFLKIFSSENAGQKYILQEASMEGPL